MVFSYNNDEEGSGDQALSSQTMILFLLLGSLVCIREEDVQLILEPSISNLVKL